jgi:hypothetical protein
MALTEKKIASLSAAGRHLDDGGLYLRIAPGGSKQWQFRFKRDGRERFLGLGSVAQGVTLREARAARDELRRLLRQGVDPVEQRAIARRERRLRQVKPTSFTEVLSDYIQQHGGKWDTPHASQWVSSFERYVTPLIGKLAVAEVDKQLVLKIIEPL